MNHLFKYIIPLFFPFICFSQSETPVAIFALKANGIASADASAYTNRFRSELFNLGKFVIVERSQMDLILKEQGFQQTGCTSVQCAVEAGQLIGVQKIIIGSIDKVGNFYSINFRLVDVGTGKIELNFSSDCESCTPATIMKIEIANAARHFSGLPPILKSTQENQYATQTIIQSNFIPKRFQISVSYGLLGGQWEYFAPKLEARILKRNMEYTANLLYVADDYNEASFWCVNYPVERRVRKILFIS